jgi:XTP/dITP diphosphohydrolase
MTQRLILASTTRQTEEFSEILAPLGFELHPQDRFNVPEADEPFATFVENAWPKRATPRA